MLHYREGFAPWTVELLPVQRTLPWNTCGDTQGLVRFLQPSNIEYNFMSQLRCGTGFIDQPQEQAEERQHNEQEKYGEKTHLFLVKGRIAFALIVCLKKHDSSYCKPARSANWF